MVTLSINPRLGEASVSTVLKDALMGRQLDRRRHAVQHRGDVHHDVRKNRSDREHAGQKRGQSPAPACGGIPKLVHRPGSVHEEHREDTEQEGVDDTVQAAIPEEGPDQVRPLGRTEAG